MLGPRFTRTSQPQGAAGINWGNPLARGLAQCVLTVNGSPTQIVGSGLTQNGTLGRTTTRNGIAVTNNGEIVSNGSASNFLSLPVTQSAVTVLYVGGRFSTPTNSNQIAVAVATRANNDNSGFEVDLGNAFGDANLLYFYDFAGGANHSVWVDGQKATGNNPTNVSIATGRAYSIVASMSTHTAGAGHTVLAKAAGTNDYACNVFCNVYAQWNRQLTEAEHASLSRNPWQLFAPQERPIWVPVSAAGGGVSGTSATTNAADTSSAAGTTTVVGTSATTNAADTSTASGTTIVLGTSATTNAADTSSATGTVGSGGSVSGTSATTNAADTSSATGTTTVRGTSATTNAADTASAQGWAGVVSGTVAYTNNPDTSSASGDAGPVQATGKGGHVYLRSGFVQARKRLHLQRILDFLTEEEPQEETKRIIRAVKAGKPVEQDKKPPVVLKEVSAEKLAAKIKPERVAQLPPDIDLQQVIRRAIELAQEQDDEDILLLL